MKTSKYPTLSSTKTMFKPSAKKIKKFMVETKEFGLGYILEHEPPVILKRGMIASEKIQVHLVKDNMEERTMGTGANKKPKIVLMSASNYKVLLPPKSAKFVRQEDNSFKDENSDAVIFPTDPLWNEINEAVLRTEQRVKKTTVKGEGSPKDFTQYKFNGKTLGKGKLVLEIVRKFVTDNNPTFLELRKAFPETEVRAYKGLFVTADEATAINEADKRRSRFFTNKEDILKLKGNAKVSVTNQVTADLVSRMIPIATKHGFTIKEIKSEAPVAKKKETKTKLPTPAKVRVSMEGESKKILIKSFEQANRVVEKYIAKNNLEAGQFLGGQIFDKNNKQFAYVSNGKVLTGKVVGQGTEIAI